MTLSPLSEVPGTGLSFVAHRSIEDGNLVVNAYTPP
jgi:hypothetical protein